MATYYLLGKSCWEGDGWSIQGISDDKKHLESVERSEDMTDGTYHLIVLSKSECKRRFGKSFEIMEEMYFQA